VKGFPGEATSQNFKIAQDLGFTKIVFFVKVTSVKNSVSIE